MYKLLLLYVVSITFYPLVFAAAVIKTLLKYILPAARPKCIKDEIALVTGGAAGFGRCICFELAQRGCNVAVVDVNLPGAEQVASALQEKYGIKAVAYQVDVSDRAAVIQLGAKVRQDFAGEVTLLFNNAGLILFDNMHQPDWREVQRMVNVNVTAHLWTNEVFLPPMQRLERGHIIATASIAGLVPLIHYPVYSATKFAVRGLMRSLRLTLRGEGHTNIRTSIVYPYFMRTSLGIRTLIDQLDVAKLLPALMEQQAAQRAVAGVLRNEDEIAMPHIFKLLQRMLDVLPTDWQDHLNYAFTCMFSARFLSMRPTTATTTAGIGIKNNAVDK